MFVVSTISQLEEAIRARAREVMVIGSFAPELLKMLEFPASISSRDFKAGFSYASLYKSFSVLAVYDSNQNVTATVLQKRSEHLGRREDFLRQRAGRGELL